ncbi:MULTISPECIES: hypothetical protein [Streptomyces]|uniref:Uncharacterized protein n=1 Tax=Streptomyces ehimensis TaxID=68195 RepID=A0ABV9BUG8_9ACTN
MQSQLDFDALDITNIELPEDEQVFDSLADGSAHSEIGASCYRFCYHCSYVI